MEITISKTALFNKLKSLSKIIQPKNSLVAYDSFLFECTDNILTITAGEEAGRISSVVECIYNGSISFIVPAKTILDGLKDIPEQPLLFSIGKNYTITCTYSAGKGKFTFVGCPAEDYPSIKLPDVNSSLDIFAQDILYGIGQVQKCTANDELRPVMNGVFFDQDGEKISYVGTNGTSLGLVETNLDGGKERCSFIIPAKFSQILLNILDHVNTKGNISVHGNNVLFAFDGYKLICRMIEGKYPNYRAVIPKNNINKFNVSKIDLLAALKRVSVFSSKSTPVIVFNMNLDSIDIEAHDTDFSLSAQETIKAIYGGSNIKIGFNANILKELVSSIPCDDMDFSFSDAIHPVIISRTDEPISSLTYLIVPMQINL